MIANSQPLESAARELSALYPECKEQAITSRRFKHVELMEWLKPMRERGVYSWEELGKSAEGRSINLLTVGKGQTTVMLWSQMHGDEPTATMAIVDILHFFEKYPDNVIAKTVKQSCTVYFIPMVNPDGAERFQRRNAQQIDLNRDFLHPQTSEARLLKGIRDKLQPQFGFNLHDQDPRNTVGETNKSTAIGMLAPATNVEKSDNAVRIRAKHVASVFTQTANLFIPGHVAKYDDTYEPRAFGDNFQKAGTSTVLVESGGYADDPQKMHLRMINFIGLLTCLYAIANDSYESADINIYEQLPFSTEKIFDLVIRNVRFQDTTTVNEIIVDVGINVNERLDSRSGKPVKMFTVVDMGDLSTFCGFEELNGKGLLYDRSTFSLHRQVRYSVIDSIRTGK
jgi:hypothetical protein